MPPVGFEPTISAGERPKTYALDRAATGIGICSLYFPKILEEYKTLRQENSMAEVFAET